MIIDLIVSAFLALIDGLVSLFPSFTMPDELILTALTPVLQLNPFFPVVTLFTTLIAAMVIELALRGWDLTVWVYHQFWGSE